MAQKLHHKALRLIFSAVNRKHAPAPPFSPERVRNILIMNTTSIGDTLLSTPAIRAIRKGFPDARITSLANSAAEQVLRSSPHIDGCIMHPGRINLKYLLRLPWLVKGLRRQGFDLVVELYANDPDKGPLAYITGAPWRIGSIRSDFSFLYTTAVPPVLPGVHCVDTKLKNLEQIGIEPEGRGMEIFLTEDDNKEAREVLEDLKPRTDKFITVHPFGSKANKRWPEENVKRFLKMVIEKTGFTPIIIGGKEESETADRVAKAAGAASAAGRLSIRGSAALISGSELIVTTDSGPMHMAQALGVPTIALFGPDSPALTGPVNPDDVVIQKNLPCVPCLERTCRLPELECMISITPEEVLDQVRKILSQYVSLGVK